MQLLPPPPDPHPPHTQLQQGWFSVLVYSVLCTPSTAPGCMAVEGVGVATEGRGREEVQCCPKEEQGRVNINRQIASPLRAPPFSLLPPLMALMERTVASRFAHGGQATLRSVGPSRNEAIGSIFKKIFLVQYPNLLFFPPPLCGGASSAAAILSDSSRWRARGSEHLHVDDDVADADDAMQRCGRLLLSQGAEGWERRSGATRPPRPTDSHIGAQSSAGSAGSSSVVTRARQMGSSVSSGSHPRLPPGPRAAAGNGRGCELPHRDGRHESRRGWEAMRAAPQRGTAGTARTRHPVDAQCRKVHIRI